MTTAPAATTTTKAPKAAKTTKKAQATPTTTAAEIIQQTPAVEEIRSTATVAKESLKDALKHVGQAIAAKSALPVLGMVRLITSDNTLTLQTTNLELGLTVQIPAKTSALFRSVCIPWKLLNDIVGAIPGDTIDLDVQHASIRLTSGGFETTLMGMEGDEFPTIPTPNGEPTLRVPATAFTQAVRAVASSAATTMDRPVLTGVRLMVANGKLSLTAADGLRLAKASFDSEATPITSIMHAPALEAVESLFAEESADLGVFVTPNQVFVQSPTATAVMRVIDGKYPDAERIIPTSRKVQITANRQEMVNAIKLAKLFAASSSHMCRMEIGTDTITLLSNAAEMGNQHAIVDATIVGEAFPIAFNASFMDRFLKAITGEQVVIESNGPTSPIVLTDPANANQVFIIMPMSVR